jgi:ATP-dependent helicase/nuclease subunit B
LASPVSVFAHSLISLAINKSDRDALFRLLKTGLLEIESGTKNEEIINETRENNYKLRDIESRGKFKEITEFINSFRAARTAHEKTKILSKKIEAADDTEKGKKIVEMLSGIGAFLGETKIKNDEFLTIVSDGIMSINVGVLPPAQDIVIVGDIKRSRSSNIKVLFMLGVNDGIIPSAKKENSFLLEAEKQLLSSQSPIGKTPEILLEEESIAIKKNLAVPSEKLILSYSTSSRGSEALYESVIIKNARQKRKASERESYSENSYEFVRNEKTARLFLASKPESKAVRALFLFADASSEKSFAPGEKKMRGDLAEKFSAAGIISLSASSLEKYSRCPYSFFLAKMLGLKEERIRDFTGTDFGQIYHKVLQDFFMSLGEKNYMVGGEVSRGEVAAATERIFESEMAKYKEGLLTISEYQKYKAVRIKKTAVAGVFDIYSEFALASEAGKSFVEVAFEHGKALAPLAIGKGYEAHGRIDRYDRLGSELRVIDYKTYGKELFPKNILSGYDMQLMVYSLALTQNAGSSVPASPYYIELKDMAMKDKSLSYKLSGIKGLSKMKEEEREEELRKLAGAFMCKTEKTFDDFSSGIITPRPLTSVEPSMGGRITACTYCSYASVCHYDAEGMNMRA